MSSSTVARRIKKNLHERFLVLLSTPSSTLVALIVFSRKACAARMLEVVARAGRGNCSSLRSNEPCITSRNLRPVTHDVAEIMRRHIYNELQRFVLGVIVLIGVGAFVIVTVLAT